MSLKFRLVVSEIVIGAIILSILFSIELLDLGKEIPLTAELEWVSKLIKGNTFFIALFVMGGAAILAFMNVIEAFMNKSKKFENFLGSSIIISSLLTMAGSYGIFYYFSRL